MPTDALDRFAVKVDMSGECWEWLAAKHRKGYGQFRHDGSMRQAHRWLWEQTVGPIPEGLELDHLCRNRGCVNPDHLEPVTHAENVARTTGFKRPATSAHWARWQAEHPECPQGHEFNEENTVFYKNKRQCRPCNKARSAAYRARQNYSEFAN